MPIRDRWLFWGGGGGPSIRGQITTLEVFSFLDKFRTRSDRGVRNYRRRAYAPVSGGRRFYRPFVRYATWIECTGCLFLLRAGELMVLALGLHYGNSARNARVQFDERRFLFYAITAELTFGSIFNAVRAVYPVPFHQDATFAAAFLRGLTTNTLALLIIFVPKVRLRNRVALRKHACALVFFFFLRYCRQTNGKLLV